MRSKRRTIGHLCATITNIDCRIAILEMIAVYKMIIAEDAQSGCIDKVIAIHLVEVSMTKRELCRAITDRIITDGNTRCLYRDQFVFAITIFKQIIFNNTVA